MVVMGVGATFDASSYPNAKSTAVGLPLWSIERGCFLCALGQEDEFAGKAVLLDRTVFSSASQAVEQLNLDDSSLCPEGLCVLFSTGEQMYFLLFRKDRRSVAIALFGLTEKPRVEASAVSSRSDLADAAFATEGTQQLQDHPWATPPWIAGRQAERIARYGLDSPNVHTLMESAEFISLGSYCGVAFTLQALGLRKSSYPFDWLRCSAEGVLQCVQTEFADFFTYSFCQDVDNARLYGGSRWGGSFWHHNPDDPTVQHSFLRRIDRLLGQREVAASVPRVFIRACNSTSELRTLLQLRNALRQRLPRTQVYFLAIVDLQQFKGPVQISGDDDFIFYKVHASLWADPTVHFARQMEANTEAYCEAVSCALRFWAGEADVSVMQVQQIQDLEALCNPFQAGHADSELFKPLHLEHFNRQESAAKADADAHVPPEPCRNQISI